MSVPIITVDGLHKKYRIHHQAAREPYVALRDVLAQALTRPFRRGAPRAADEDFWALTDVSFEVKPGEVLGIIGRNGAGKSTLLKILSRITEPTAGRVELRGRAAAMLEVGTGFHPELSGRDNIFLNGAILGMSRTEITRKFDEIVAFAGTEQFLDTPVKRYSSGMYVRLAFAVAAHLEPEILIVDEVLSVGDAEFQRKCLGKVGEVARGGRTVLIVSHQLATIENLCDTGLLLRRGTVASHGPVSEVLAAYAGGLSDAQAIPMLERTDRKGDGSVRFAAARLVSDDGRPLQHLTAGASAIMELSLHNPRRESLRGLHVSIAVTNALGQRVTTWSTTYAGGDFPSTPARDFTLQVHLPRLALVPASYSFNLFAGVNGDVADWLMPAGGFDVDPGDYFGSGQVPVPTDAVFISDHSFTLQ